MNLKAKKQFNIRLQRDDRLLYILPGTIVTSVKPINTYKAAIF